MILVEVFMRSCLFFVCKIRLFGVKLEKRSLLGIRCCLSLNVNACKYSE